MYRALFFLYVFLLAIACVSAAPVIEKRVNHYGEGTWYDPSNPDENGGNTVNACGSKDTKSDLVVAMSTKFFNANNGVNCNQWVKLKNTANGKIAYAQMRDSCEGCGWDDLDLTPAVFKKLAPLDQGIVKIQWNFMNKKWQP